MFVAARLDDGPWDLASRLKRKQNIGLVFPPFKATSAGTLPNYRKYALPHILKVAN